MASPSADVEPQNERGHVYKFSSLPQSETETDGHNHHQHQLPLSISVESTATRPTITDCYSDQISSLSARTSEMTQDLIGLTVLMMLIFLLLYSRLGSPNEDPVPAVFILNSMYISNFTAANGELAATWDAKFTVINTNVSSIYFRSIDYAIFYKHIPEHPLSTASSYPFYLDQGEEVKLHLKFRTTGWEDNQPFVKNWLVEEIGKDRAKDGAVSFGMQMKVEAIYYGETWVSGVVMRPHCEGLTVKFVPNMDVGRLANLNRNFSVPIERKPFSFF